MRLQNACDAEQPCWGHLLPCVTTCGRRLILPSTRNLDRNRCDHRKWQATWWPGATSRSAGTSIRQRASA